MYYKIILIGLIGLNSLSFATTKDSSNSQRYEQGFVWYDDANKTSTKTHKKIDEKVLIKKVLAELEKNNKLQEKILQVLQKAYDPQPETIIGDDGKPCIANSSAECFKMPVIPEAQQIPVLTAWLKNPSSIETAKKFLQWQAKFLDLKDKGGYSLNLAGKQYGDEAYPIGAVTEEWGTKNGKYLRHRKKQLIRLISKYAHNMNIYVLLGETPGFEIEYPQQFFDVYDLARKIGANSKLVLKDSTYEAKFSTIMSMSANDSHNIRWEEMKKEGGVIISPKTFASLKPYATPYIVLEYKSKDKKFSQVISVGRDTPEDAIINIYRTLLLNDVVESKQMYGSKAAQDIEEEIITNLKKRNQND